MSTDLDPVKAKAIQVMEPPTTYKQLNSVMRRVPYVSRSIPAFRAPQAVLQIAQEECTISTR